MTSDDRARGGDDSARGGDGSGRGGDGSGGGPGSAGSPASPASAASPAEFDEAAFEAAFAAEFGEAVEPQRALRPEPGEPEAAQEATPSSDERRVLAVVLTPIASAPVLAALCAMTGLDADIVPSKRGALAAKVITTSGELDPSELLTGAPAEAGELAAALSRTAKLGVVLLTARLGKGDEGISGTISGRQYVGGEPGEEVSPGLVLAHADDVVEQILLGALDPAQAPGRLVPKEMSRWQAARLMAKQARKRRP